MNVRTYIGIALFVGIASGSAWGAAPSYAMEASELASFHEAQNELTALSQRLGQNNPEVVSQRAQVDMLRQQLLSDVDSRRTHTKHDFDSIDQRVREAEGALRNMTGRTDVSLASLQAAVESLDKEREALMLENAAANARREAIEDAVHRQSIRSHDIAENDAASAEIQKEIEALEQRLKFLQDSAKSGLNTPADVTAAQAALAEAQTKLAERRDAVSAEAGGSLLAELNRELVNGEIAASERKAKEKFINERLHDLGEALRVADDRDLANLLLQRAAAQAEAEKAAEDWQNIHDELASPPTTQPAQ